MTRFFKPFTMICAIFFSLTQISCNSDDDANDDANAECQNTICTLEFVVISVSVSDQNQNPVALDSFSVTDVENGNNRTITLTPSEFAAAQEFGRYPLITDGILGLNQERQIQFRGFLNNQEVISANYTVATDCCHISVVAGDLQLTL
ncbi:hypothetical protein [Spongiimicrobium salis]|uniref:hypothetical protein n=1 Tax=Spongiimicrobium salis TaxID=1667022 RepID=UPI00374CC6DA